MEVDRLPQNTKIGLEYVRGWVREGEKKCVRMCACACVCVSAVPLSPTLFSILLSIDQSNGVLLCLAPCPLSLQLVLLGILHQPCRYTAIFFFVVNCAVLRRLTRFPPLHRHCLSLPNFGGFLLSRSVYFCACVLTSCRYMGFFCVLFACYYCLISILPPPVDDGQGFFFDDGCAEEGMESYSDRV